MLVEHTFITTLDAAEAMGTASAFLQARGFTVPPKTSFPVGGWTTLEVRRGVTNAAKAKSTIEVPQQIHMQWDRGRVEVAASATPRPRGSGKLVTGVVRAGDLGGTSKKDAAVGQMLLTYAHALDLLLAQRQPEQAAAAWDAFDAQLRELAQAQRRRGQRNMWIVIGIFAVLIGALIYTLSAY